MRRRAVPYRCGRGGSRVRVGVDVIYVFAGCELDTDTYELRRNGDVVGIEPQVYDVLVYLLEHRDRVVAKEELLDEVWKTRFVTESTFSPPRSGSRSCEPSAWAEPAISTPTRGSMSSS